MDGNNVFVLLSKLNVHLQKPQHIITQTVIKKRKLAACVICQILWVTHSQAATKHT